MYPTKSQIRILTTTLETCKRLYNDSLDERIKDWDVGFYEQKKLLTLRKQDNKYYKQVYSQVLQDVVLRLDKAYEAFFKKLSRYPRFKIREKYNSFTYPQYGGFRVKADKLLLSYIGPVKMKIHRKLVGILKQCTIVRDVDQWYCCMTSESGLNPHDSNNLKDAVGVDVGLLTWMTLSNGNKIASTIDQSQIIRIKLLQRELMRKKKGSSNREKTRIAIAKEWRKLRRRREDFVHKESKKLADNYSRVIFEKLNISSMVRNHSLAQAIMDATWGKLRIYTAYKAKSRGGQLIVVNPCGTSQKCSRCGLIAEPKLDLSVRRFECRSCGLNLDRDHNAALNILKLGLERAHAETDPPIVRQRISKFQSRKQEVHE